jgi:hypothetical protein
MSSLSYEEKAAKYYENHLICVSNYQKKNKDKINSKMKLYYERNRDEIIQRSKDYYYKNKEKIKEKKRLAKLRLIQDDPVDDLNKIT